MNKIFGLMLLSATSIVSGCDKEQEEAAPICEVNATVRDLRGLDGCGFIFELEDGTRLEPIRIFNCGAAPMPIERTADPLLSFEFAEGKKVKINYDLMSEIGTACMAGTPVKITCLTEESGNETAL